MAKNITITVQFLGYPKVTFGLSPQDMTESGFVIGVMRNLPSGLNPIERSFCLKGSKLPSFVMGNLDFSQSKSIITEVLRLHKEGKPIMFVESQSWINITVLPFSKPVQYIELQLPLNFPILDSILGQIMGPGYRIQICDEKNRGDCTSHAPLIIKQDDIINNRFDREYLVAGLNHFKYIQQHKPLVTIRMYSSIIQVEISDDDDNAWLQLFGPDSNRGTKMFKLSNGLPWKLDTKCPNDVDSFNHDVIVQMIRNCPDIREISQIKETTYNFCFKFSGTGTDQCFKVTTCSKSPKSSKPYDEIWKQITDCSYLYGGVRWISDDEKVGPFDLGQKPPKYQIIKLIVESPSWVVFREYKEMDKIKQREPNAGSTIYDVAVNESEGLFGTVIATRNNTDMRSNSESKSKQSEIKPSKVNPQVLAGYLVSIDGVKHWVGSSDDTPYLCSALCLPKKTDYVNSDGKPKRTKFPIFLRPILPSSIRLLTGTPITNLKKETRILEVDTYALIIGV